MGFVPRLDEGLSAFPQLDLTRRVEVLDLLIDFAHGEDATQTPGPANPLRRLHDRARTRPALLGRALSFLETCDDDDDDGYCTFCVENQGVYVWSFRDAEEPDPLVYGRWNEAGVPWSAEGARMSEFLVEALILEEALGGTPYGASASWVSAAEVDRVATHVRALDLPLWRWPAFPTRFYASRGVFAVAAPNGEADGCAGYSIFIGARSDESLGPLREIVDDTWEYRAL